MATEWLSSKEAARRLGVSAATLYAYVSRGLLRSEGTNGQRERRYRADDVAQLKRRRDVGRKAESIAAHALDFGTPVLESSLTLIENGRLFYRGQDAARLARNSSLEQVAQLLWDCDDRPFAPRNRPPPPCRRSMPASSCSRRRHAGIIRAGSRIALPCWRPACASCGCWRLP